MPKNRMVIFVIKDVFTTRFMQNAGMFENFKFAGVLVKGSQSPSHQHLSAKELLKRTTKATDDRYCTVGVIIPDVGAAFQPGHAVYSNGHQWTMIEDICKAYNATLEQ